MMREFRDADYFIQVSSGSLLAKVECFREHYDLS